MWQLIFLDQLGADGSDTRVQAACEYVLTLSQAEMGGFAASGSKKEAPPPPTRVIHCLNGNLLIPALLDADFAACVYFCHATATPL